MQSHGPDYRKYLDPKVLAQISGLELRARLVVEGFFSGTHPSPFRGLSTEFADHRAYVQGDDLRHIDWRVFGRTDKYYIKQYEQETNLNLLLVVDSSESMNYTSTPELMTKYEYATALAAAIAYLTLKQHDSVGLTLFDNHLTDFIRPSNRSHQWQTLIKEMDGKTGPAKTDLGRVLGEVAERLSKRTLIILISDLFDETDAVLRGLKQLHFRRHEIIVWHLWDPAELTFPFRGHVQFEGLEDTGHVRVDPGALRAEYLNEVERFQRTLRAACVHMNLDYAVFDTSMPLDSVLSEYLTTRSVRLRLRSSRVMGGG